jgi:eukaryotic-like serine/threonine-protein kinase
MGYLLFMDNSSERRYPFEDAAPQVAGYVVGRKLGRGASAAVWLVTEERSGRRFALKCFAPSLGPDGGGNEPGLAEVEAGVRKEIRILSVLEHEHLVKAHSVVRLDGAGDGGLGLVMDYAAGGSLAQLVASRGKLSVGETVTILTPVAQALAYLHGKGFTHSDVSPGNVLFSGQGKPLLADLGLGRMLGEAADASAQGTAGFADPSPVDAVRAGLQPERDVYSAAALGWYCLTGLAPQPSAQRPPLSLLVPDVPAELAAALEAGLCEDRRMRPGAAELAAAVYRSAPAAPVDLSVSVHPAVLPELLTRRAAPGPRYSRYKQVLRALGRRLPGMRPGSPHPDGGRKQRRQRAKGPGRLGPGAQESGGLGPGDPGPAGGRPGGGTGPRHSRRAASKPAVNRVAYAAVLAVAAASVVCFLWVAGGLQESPSQGQSATAAAGHERAGERTAVPDHIQELLAAADPVQAVHGLAWLRSHALSSGELDLLDEVNAANSAAAAADNAVRARLAGSGHVLEGFTTTLAQVSASPESTRERAVVAVSSATSAFEERNAAGDVVASGAAGAGQRLRLVLVPVDGKWRIREILGPG